ncbi:MAG: hypothetical protein OXN17_13275 [Candidatus Poribacteria bacterium]|nr:hypothetical protein [Candidatus Poribacteria bacterium]
MASNKFSPAFLEKIDENGSRFVERMMTTVAALKQQSRNVLQYLIAACNAHIESERCPVPTFEPFSLNNSPNQPIHNLDAYE